MKKMVTALKETTYRQRLFIFILSLSIIFSIIFVYNNYRFYDQPIAKITDVSITDTVETTDRYDNKDTLATQKIIAIIKNGVEQGQQVTLLNKYSASGAYDNEYKIGDEVFISIESDTTGMILEVKRDKYIVIVAWVFIIVLLLVGKVQGLFASISLGFNLLVLSLALDLYINTGLNLLWISAFLVIIFTVTSLLLVNGFGEKTYAAIIATILGTFSALLIVFIAMKLTSEKGLFYEEMQFLTRPYKLVFMAGLFIGALGAVMDVAITMSSSIFELVEKNKQISIKALKKSAFEIGTDIMGTMTNILFFAYISGSIPMLLLYFKNYTDLDFALSMNLSLELARALAGGIGIVLTIPIGLYVSIFFVKRKRSRT